MRALFFSIELIFQSVLDITFVSKLDRLSSSCGFLMVLGAYGFFVVKDKIKVLDKLVKESESVLAVTKTHSKNAKKYEEEAKVVFNGVRLPL
jgi:hypothetical protein